MFFSHGNMHVANRVLSGNIFEGFFVLSMSFLVITAVECGFVLGFAPVNLICF